MSTLTSNLDKVTALLFLVLSFYIRAQWHHQDLLQGKQRISGSGSAATVTNAVLTETAVR